MTTARDINTAMDLPAIDSSCGLALIDHAGKMISVNPAFLKLFALPPDVQNKTFAELTGAMNPVATHFLLQAIDGEHGIVSKRTIVIDNKTLTAHIIELNQAQRLMMVESLPASLFPTPEINHPARTPGTASLINRSMLSKHIANWKPDRSGTVTPAMLMIGLDRFKRINETLGHDSGDQLLKFTAQRLLRVIRSDDIVAHFAGDQFAILQINQNQPVAATTMAERIAELLKRPFLVNGQQVNISASIGLAILYQDTESTTDLIKHAELALYDAKHNARGGYRRYEQSLQQSASEQHELEVNLRRALFLQEFTLFYQPQVRMHDKKIVGFEALIRWEKLGAGIISPLRFIPLAEDTREIHEIGQWVLQTACREAATWPENIQIAVNVSPVQFESNNLKQIVQAALAASGLAPQRLELEITEGLLIKNMANALDQLKEILTMGVSVALDDFGTGYSSLNYLSSFPFSKIKIDQSFVHRMHTDKSRTLIKAVIALGSALGIKTLAEGVETEEQFDYLARNGCEEIQGYLISKPVPAEQIPALIS
ncbi:MAG: bifunctional diguanylate cyclase/phosphodiesterase [Proteobacteria bacterium]|nr:bifunctional diguanylate cyclase/phosphodiesterase [Pseudomonadota bacterium]